MMLEIYDRGRIKKAVLQNASAIVETLSINKIYTLSFSLPYNDPKNAFCQPLCLAKWNSRLYRIQPSTLEITDVGEIAYTCEHVISTLMDKVMFGYFHIGGQGVDTTEVIKWLLSKQSDWRLGSCELSRQFEYGWEQETLLSALLSVPSRMTDAYMWDYSTATYPWSLSLKRIDIGAIPQFYIRDQKNTLRLSRKSNPQELCTRLYPLGFGEGVNQLKISPVNGGVPYLQSPKAVTDAYGIVERIWIDRRYEDAESLKQAASAMLEELQTPYESYEIDAAELSGGGFDTADVGKIVQVIDRRTGFCKKSYITEIVRNWNDVTTSGVTIANRPRDIASTIADMADKQRIEAAYAQGATQIYSQSLQANADASEGASLDFYIPPEMRIVNKVLLRVRMEQFRAFSQATDGGGSTTVTSSAGGGSQSTTSAGGSTQTTTRSGGKKSGTSGFSLRVGSMTDRGDSASSKMTLENHTHPFTLPKHEHSFESPSHSHDLDIDDHSHTVSSPNHEHSISLPNHTHTVKPGIYRFGNATAFTIFVNGQRRGTVNATSSEVDLTPHLLGTGNMIPRGSWLSVEIRPNELAYISLVLFVQGFIQSRGDQTV